VQIPVDPHGDPFVAAAYGIGGTSTILVTVVLWRLRPYRRLEQEVAACFTAVAEFILRAATG